MTDTDQVVPGDRWVFDDEVAAVFDDMLARSIPQYDVMRAAVADVGARYVQPNTAVLDLGCSRGQAIASFVGRFPEARHVGVEVSEPMRNACAERFGDRVEVLDFDLRNGYPLPHGSASLTLCVLTLQFTPIEHRQRILADAYNATVNGGALVLVEKVLGSDAHIDAMLVDLYYAMKREHGYTEEAIQRKRLSLEGVLVPVTAKWNEDLLRGAGFRRVDCFWRWMNFGAWIAVR
jgi:tRNA (cmo5U34)-methyltransferase